MRMSEGNKAEAQKKEKVDVESATKKLEEKRRKKAELKRQAGLCAEMEMEERICKEFYRWELAQNLR